MQECLQQQAPAYRRRPQISLEQSYWLPWQVAGVATWPGLQHITDSVFRLRAACTCRWEPQPGMTLTWPCSMPARYTMYTIMVHDVQQYNIQKRKTSFAKAFKPANPSLHHNLFSLTTTQPVQPLLAKTRLQRLTSKHSHACTVGACWTGHHNHHPGQFASTFLNHGTRALSHRATACRRLVASSSREQADCAACTEPV